MILTQQEQETHLSMTADDRGKWHAYSDDPVMQRRLEAIGATVVRVAADGIGKHYELDASKILLRKGKRRVSEAQRIESSMRLRALRATPDGA